MGHIFLKAIAPLIRVTVQDRQEGRAPRLGAALVYYIALSLTPTMVITLGVAGFAFGDTAAEGRLVSWGLVGHNGAKPDVHGFVRCRTEVWNMFLDGTGGCCCNRYFACVPRDGLAEDANAAGSAFW